MKDTYEWRPIKWPAFDRTEQSIRSRVTVDEDQISKDEFE